MIEAVIAAAAGALLGGIISYIVSKRLARDAMLFQRELSMQADKQARLANEQTRLLSDNHDRFLQQIEQEKMDHARLINDHREEFLQQMARKRERFEEDTYYRRNMLTFLGRVREFASEVLNHTLPNMIAQEDGSPIVDQLEHQLGTLSKRLHFERRYEFNHELPGVVHRELGNYLGVLRHFKSGECTLNQVHSERLSTRDRINDLLWRIEDSR